jgi:flagellar biosynthetic protein FlhB
MAGANEGQERTEQATPKRLQDAAKKGQVARSRELTTFALLLGAAGGLLLFGPLLLEGLVDQMRDSLRMDGQAIFDHMTLPTTLRQAIARGVWLIAPFLALLFLIALAAPIALGGWSFSSQSLALKWERISPAKGLGRMFSWRALMELVKALAKFLVTATVAVTILWIKEPELLHLGSEPLLPALAHTAQQLGWIFLLLTLPLMLVAAVDVPFQLFDHARQLKMTKQEVRDESKDTEGKPEVKGRIRRLQQEFAQRRMMEKVPGADVVITNPTHFAVALKYDQEAMGAPVMLAKGTELTALRIRSLAGDNRVPQVESPLLARALYYNGELDKPIPSALYLAVAQVLAYVFQLRQEQGVSDDPIVMTDVPVPSELRTQ